MAVIHLVALLAVSAVQSQSPQAQIDFGKAWEGVSSAISRRYYAREAKHAEMEKLLQKYASKAKSARSIPEFSKAVNEMIDEFGDSHFDLFTTDDQGYYLMDGLMKPTGAAPMPHIGAWFRPAEGGFEVQMLLEETPAAKAGLRKGDIVTAANGKPFQPVASLKGLETVRLSVLRNSKPLEVQAEVLGEPALDAFLNASRNSTKVIERNGKKIGYFHLWTQANDSFRNALSSAVYGKLMDTDAFILDLRDGFGGRPEAFADPFFRPEAELGWQMPGSPMMRQQFGYQRPLIVLINEGSRSAKEVLAYVLKKSGRATLIGTRTAGHVLGTSPARLTDWAYLEIPMVEVFADGQRMEGVGVSPHVEVRPEFDDKGNDRVLAEALNCAEKMTAKKGSGGQNAA